MFTKLSLLATVLTPLVAALTVEVPQNPESGSQVTIHWESQPGDPAVFSIFLDDKVLNDFFGIANNVPTDLGELTLTLPIVPPSDGYTIELVDIADINNVFASSGTFSIGEATTSDTNSATSAT